MTVRIDGLEFKGLPLGATYDPAALGDLGWNVSRGDTATPLATLSRPALADNAAAMREWCERSGVDIAPHAKTTMSSEIVDLQLEAGAWGMTAALPRQVGVVWGFGVHRVILANEVSDPAAIAWMGSRLGDERTVYVYADSIEGVGILHDALVDAPRRLPVLIELGYPGGRTGARSVADAIAVAEAVVASDRLELAGVALFEGALGGAHRTAERLAAVDAFLTDLGDLARSLAGRFESSEPVITAGGSLYFDRVAAVLGPVAHELDARVVIRSGCYLVHDHGMYEGGTPSATGVGDAPHFRPALSVWSRVVSAPESGLALLDAGRRDVSYDDDLPIPLERWRDGDVLELRAAATVGSLSDQHAFLHHPELDIRAGDLVRLGVSHPCTTFDRWRLMLVTDDDYSVLDGLRTDF